MLSLQLPWRRQPEAGALPSGPFTLADFNLRAFVVISRKCEYNSCLEFHESF